MHRFLLSLLAACCFTLFGLAGCGGDGSSSGASADSSAGSSVQAYTVRGVVRGLPDASRPGSDFFVHHEAIPDFVNDEGETVGMGSMAMPFPVPDPAILEGVTVGDKVSMRFEVEWEGSPPLRVVALEVLPPETVLDFETPTNESDSVDESEPADEPEAAEAGESHSHGHDAD